MIPIIFAEFLLKLWKIVIAEEYVSAYFSATQKQNTTKQRFVDVHGWNVTYSPPKNSYRTHVYCKVFPSDSMSGIGTLKIHTNPLTDKSTSGRTKTPAEKNSRNPEATSNTYYRPMGRLYIPGNSAGDLLGMVKT